MVTTSGVDTVIFACVHNAGRSQMAAALFNAFADPDRARAVSAGTQPADVIHPLVIQAMLEVGIDLSERRPQLLTEELVASGSMLVTMGCSEECPVVPGVEREDWPLPDPRDQPLEVVRAIRDRIRQHVATLAASRGWQRAS